MTMAKSNQEEMQIRSAYFAWLCSQIERRQSDEVYEPFLASLHKKEFIVVVPNDENRAEDGKKLRERFADGAGKEILRYMENEPCSVLEMLVALANRIEGVLLDPSKNHRSLVPTWFWKMIDNLSLEPFTDTDLDAKNKRFRNNQILKDFLNRRYSRFGQGGLFPLRRLRTPNEDQRYVEIWYQLMAYLDENYRF